VFFKRNNNNFIEFWDCPSNHKWPLHKRVDKETKEFNILPIFLCKLLWDFSKKSKYDSILNNWKMSFQASNTKGHSFMNLLDENSNSIELYAAKGGSWLRFFGHSNSLCTRATRAIVNHAPIGEY